MKSRSWLFIPALAGLLGSACQSAHTQPAQQPQVIAVPQEEMTRPASPQATPAVGDSTPARQTPTAEIQAGPARLSYNSCNVEGPYIALTFDDGPQATLTPKLLDILKEKGVKATFFVIGENAAANPDILQREVAEGHEIGNHSWNHQAFTKAKGSGVTMQVEQTNAAIESAIGKKPVIVRPPYGSTNVAISKRLNGEYGLKVVMWDVDPLDWKIRNSDHVMSEILKSTKAGSIILSHDIHATTVAAMPATIDALLAKGFKFVTVSELIAMDRPQLAAKPSATPVATPTATSKPARKAH
jgi:peptidoglycan/xylan/chitin deacetylase (PgdA/CDA1 family)